jgi:hypothetical protein
MNPKSVVAIIKGGLGNQLFIYAAAKAFALRNGRELFLDTTRGFQNDGYGRSYRLDHFSITATPMPEEWRLAPTLKHIRHKVLRAWNKILPRAHRSYLAERRDLGVEQLTRLSPSKERVTMLGYWQDEAYFFDFSDIIREELMVPPPTDLQNLDAGNRFSKIESISLHIRRNRYNPRLDSAYYQNAIGLIKEQIVNPHFVVFGDDLEWAHKELDFEGCTMELISQNPNDELVDLWLMSCCRHAIVANSSFSWWGAWLGKPSGSRKIFFPATPGWPINAAHGWQSIPNILDITTSL